MDARKRVAWHLRRVRVAKGLSQEVLAVDAQVDYSYVSGLERGAYNPTVDILDRFARALGVDVGEFLMLPDPTEPPPQPLRPGRRRK